MIGIERPKVNLKIDDEEYFEGVVCVGIPCLLNRPNGLSCTLSVSASASTVDEEQIDALVTNLERTRKRFLRKFS